MDFFEVAVVLIISIAALMGLRIVGQTGSKSAYRDALKVKNEIIEDIKRQLVTYRNRLKASSAPPYGAETAEDITSKLPKWARPFVGPVMDWAKTEEGQKTIEGLVKKYAKTPSGGGAAADDGV